MCGKILFSSRKELRRKALKREEVRQYKRQIKNDSIIYCTSSSLNPPVETISKNVGPCRAGKGRKCEPQQRTTNAKYKRMEIQKKGRFKLFVDQIVSKGVVKRNSFRAKCSPQATNSTGSKKSRGNTSRHSKQKTVSKTQRKHANPRRIAGVSNQQWGHVQGLQFCLRTVNQKSLVIFDPSGQEVYSSNYNSSTTETIPND